MASPFASRRRLLPRRPLSRPKVCFVLPSLNGGGAERAAVQVLNALDGTKWHRQMYLFRREGPYLGDLAAGIELSSGEHHGRLPRFEELCRFLRHTAPDIVVAFLSYFSILAASRVAHFRSKVVFDQQNPNTEFLADADFGWSRSWQRRAFQTVGQVAYRAVDRVVAISKGVADDLTANFGMPPHRIDVIHNPVDVDAVTRAAAEPLEPAHQALWAHPAIVAAGRLAEQKNYLLLIDAVALLRARLPVRLFILGTGELEGALRRRIAERHLEQSIILCGFQTNPWKYIVRADVFVLTSHYEGFGNVIAEAMACGVPVVATASQGTRDIVRDGVDGLLVERHEASKVAEAIARILTEPGLQLRLADGARAGAGRFALPTIAAAYHRVFEGLLA